MLNRQYQIRTRFYHVMWLQHLRCRRHLYHTASSVFTDRKSHAFVFLVKYGIIVFKKVQTENPIFPFVFEDFEFAVDLGLSVENAFDVALLRYEVLLTLNMKRQIRIILQIIKSRTRTNHNFLVEKAFQTLALQLFDELDAILDAHGEVRGSAVDNDVSVLA